MKTDGSASGVHSITRIFHEDLDVRKCRIYRAAISLAFFLSFLSSTPFISYGSTTGAIEGIVRDRDTNQPMEGAEISVDGTRLRSVTDDEGYYVLPGVPTGIREVTVTLEGYQSVTVTDQRITVERTHRVDFLLCLIT